MIPFTNARLIVRRPATILDHGSWIPDYENMEDVPVGRYSVQPAGSQDDLNRAVSSDAQWVAYGASTSVVSTNDEITIAFDNGTTITGLEVTGPPQDWQFTGVGLSHTVIELKKRGNSQEEGAQ